MTSFDLIVTWPDSLDYPIFRQFLKNHRAKFNRVLIPIMKANRPSGVNYVNFLREQAFTDMGVELIEDYEVKGDWRSSAINAALDRSDGSHVWFTEQDFFIKNTENFYNKILDGIKLTDFIVFRDNLRLHPALMIVKRELINKTKRDFGIEEGKSDHFGKFAEQCIEIMSVNPIKPRIYALQELGLIETRDYYHMDGLTHNYHLVMDGQKENIYKPAEFILYNNYARLAQAPQSPEFLTLTFQADQLIAPLTKFFLGAE